MKNIIAVPLFAVMIASGAVVSHAVDTLTLNDKEKTISSLKDRVRFERERSLYHAGRTTYLCEKGAKCEDLRPLDECFDNFATKYIGCDEEYEREMPEEGRGIYTWKDYLLAAHLLDCQKRTERQYETCVEKITSSGGLVK